MVQLYHSFFNHLPTKICINCFHFLAIMNEAVMDISFCVNLSFHFSEINAQDCKLLGHMVVLCFIILLVSVEFEVISPSSHLILTSRTFNFSNFINLFEVPFFNFLNKVNFRIVLDS